jgi:hypothetical protein
MWSTEAIPALRDGCANLGIDPHDLIKVMSNESACLPNAHNPGGAVGLIQFEPDTLRAEGYTFGDDAFAKLSVVQQLPYVFRYYRARLSLIVKGGSGVGALYVATFLPALTVHGNEPPFVLCGHAGPFAFAYAPNIGFDVDRKGWIAVGDMTAAAERAYARCTLAQQVVAALDALDAPAS